MNNDDSWEDTAQAALEIHRRVISAVRERVTTGARKVRPRTPTSRSPSGARVRPGSAPPGRSERLSPFVRPNRDKVLVPSLENVSTMNAISEVELQVWATLRHTVVEEDKQHPRQSTSTGILERARPNDGLAEYQLNVAGRAQQQQGSAKLLPTALTPWGRETGGHRRTADDSYVGANRGRKYKTIERCVDADRHVLARDQDLDINRTYLQELDAVRQRDIERGRDSSVRYLREHAIKARKEERAFARTLWAEARANEDSQIEMIRKATQWSRDLGENALYVPHRVKERLHVLKMENGDRASKFDWEQGRGGCGLRDLDEFRPTISINSFVKGDYARLEKAFHATRCGVCGSSDLAATGCTQFQVIIPSTLPWCKL
ncbi:unnamed protein product [Ectocarpus sp. 13 AM-2016]